jgi:hypothetical protein
MINVQEHANAPSHLVVIFFSSTKLKDNAMPIRMEEDQPQNDRRDDVQPTPRDNRGGGSNPILIFLPMLIANLFKNPKQAILLILVGLAIWYFLGSGGCSLGDMGGLTQDPNNPFSMGLDFNQEKYDATKVFEPLASNRSNPIPDRVTLEKYAPTRLNQGRQGSCVGWASSYGARTILQARATGQNPNSLAFSPSYLYNQIALSGCQGAYMQDAMEVLRQQGTLPFNDFSYDESSCSRTPSRTQQQSAANYRTKGYNRLTFGGNDYRVDMNGIRQNLAQGAPVVIGMQVGGSFMQAMEGKKVWIPNSRDYSLMGYSGHAMCVIGYDDNLTPQEGGFQIMNSWGENWGDRGMAWVRYSDFDRFVKEAYGLYPMGSADQQNATKLAAKFGLVDNATKRNIAFRNVGGNLFRTQRPIKKGDKFKVEVTNSIECYTYIFGEETDGSSYVLFPYTPKHSPYCGIVGTRLFPKDHSLTADNTGQLDRIAVLVTKQPLDYQRANEAINAAQGRNFAEKVNAVLGREAIAGVKFAASSTIDFATETDKKSAVAIILEIDKQ